MALSSVDRVQIWRRFWSDKAAKALFKAQGTCSRAQLNAAFDGLDDALTTAAVAHKATFDAALGFTTTGPLYKALIMALLLNKAGRG